MRRDLLPVATLFARAVLRGEGLRSPPLGLGLPDLQADPPSNHTPLCHHTIVSQTCRKLNDGLHARSVTVEELGDFLSANVTFLHRYFQRLISVGFLGSFNTSGTSCNDLCEGTVAFLRAVDLHGVPEWSDMSCYRSHSGDVQCEEMAPKELARHGGRIANANPDEDISKIDGEHDRVPVWDAGTKFAVTYRGDGEGRLTRRVVPRQLETEVGSVRAPAGARARDPGAAPRRAAASGQQMEYNSLRHVACRIANIYRIYPACTVIKATHRSGSRVERHAHLYEDKISRLHNTAMAWVATLIREMGNRNTLAFRQKWFGGDGDLSEEQVRERILLTFNFADRVMDEGIHYVYPADEVPGTFCSGHVLAFIYKQYYLPRPSGYHESEMPVCSGDEDPSDNLCAIDNEGKFVVYICEWFMKFSEWKKVGTLLHEVVHHANPGDVSYKPDEMQHNHQMEQLDNSDNYANFGSDVVQAAWNCQETGQTDGLPFTCGGIDCPCANLKDFCDHEAFGAAIEEQCPATCGACKPPPPTPHSHIEGVPSLPTYAPTPAPTTMAPTPAPVCADMNPTLFKREATGEKLTCPELVDEFTLAVCSNPQWGHKIRLMCPLTCESCPPPDCADQEADARDKYGDGCGVYWRKPAWCGKFDDDDFSSADMCCACHRDHHNSTANDTAPAEEEEEQRGSALAPAA